MESYQNYKSKLMKLLHRCDCGKKAEWFYAPSNNWTNDFYCDDCVPRGCSCNNENIYFEYDMNPRVSISDIYNNLYVMPEPKLSPVKWFSDVRWTYLDSQFREFPCVEYMRVY